MLSLAIDLGLGQPMEHVLRSCLLAVQMAERLGLSEEERAEVYYVGLLAWVGCTADSHELAEWFGDDIALRADTYDVDLGGVRALRFALRHAGAGRTPLRRAGAAVELIASARRVIGGSMAAHCEAATLLAERLGLGPDVRRPLGQSFERWDGKGSPVGLRGEQISLSMRLVQLADIVEVFLRIGGVEAALRVARERRGTQFDPALVDLLRRDADDLLGGLDAVATWDALIDAEPGQHRVLTDEELDTALEAVADFVDLKSPYTASHSTAVAGLAAEAARRARLPEPEVTAIRRAGLLHDLGRVGVPNTVWEKPGPLSDSEMERVRLHPYLTERMLARTPALARLGALAAAHHERLDGTGYHRGLSGAALPAAARILAAADAYHAMTEPRPHRPALTEEEAAAELAGEVRSGRLDGEAANAVLAAAGHRVRHRPRNPAALTPRELEVLSLIPRGLSNREMARRLYISRKTVGNHVEHIYAKIGVSTRAGASLYAMRHGLLTDLLPQ